MHRQDIVWLKERLRTTRKKHHAALTELNQKAKAGEAPDESLGTKADHVEALAAADRIYRDFWNLATRRS